MRRGNANLLLATLAAFCLGGLLLEADSGSRWVTGADQPRGPKFQLVNRLMDPIVSRLADLWETGCPALGPGYNKR